MVRIIVVEEAAVFTIINKKCIFVPYAVLLLEMQLICIILKITIYKQKLCILASSPYFNELFVNPMEITYIIMRNIFVD